MALLDKYLANLVVGNTKLHNLHWNLEGIHFKQVHEYLEVMYDESFEYIDEVAELQKMLGEQPISTLKGYLEVATIKELEETTFSDEKAVDYALEYIKALSTQAKEIREKADEEGKFQIANMLEDHLEAYLKHEWFLSTMLK